MIARWAHWIVIIAIIFVVVAWMTIPVVADLLRAIGNFIVVIFGDVGVSILRKAGEIIRGTDATP
jgi:hypothetical protein